MGGVPPQRYQAIHVPGTSIRGQSVVARVGCPPSRPSLTVIGTVVRVLEGSCEQWWNSNLNQVEMAR